jgi:hypothetical protein
MEALRELVRRVLQLHERCLSQRPRPDQHASPSLTKFSQVIFIPRCRLEIMQKKHLGKAAGAIVTD